MKKIVRIVALLSLIMFTLLGLFFIFGVIDSNLLTSSIGKIALGLALILLGCFIGYFLLTNKDTAFQAKDDPPSHLR